MQALPPPTRLSTEPQPEIVLRVRGLCVRFGERTALHQVNLDVRAGEILGLAGPNGAGKTTLLHLIAGLFSPDEGEIVVAGQRDPTRASVRAQIGVATQAIALYGDLTAEENVTFFARLNAVGRDLDTRVHEVLAIAGLVERRHDRVKTLSGGMMRRLNLACALVHRPRLLLLDEPTAGVDPQSRNYLLEAIQALAREGHAIVVATHHMEEAARVCDRVAIMDEGRIVAIDTVGRLTDRHAGDLEETLLDLTGRATRDAREGRA